MIVCLVVLLFLLYFYRTPETQTGWLDNVIVAPSYGTVSKIGELPTSYHSKYLNDSETYTYVCIFLSPFDVHQNYYPINGYVINRIYDDTGHFKLAFQLDKSDENEKKLHFIDTKHGVVTVTQIAGALPRRIVSDYELGPCEAGRRFGMIKFGSRVDLALPSEGLTLLIKEGDTLTGGEAIGFYR
jgi:phosphatidylserine decarboxylase